MNREILVLHMSYGWRERIVKKTPRAHVALAADEVQFIGALCARAGDQSFREREDEDERLPLERLPLFDPPRLPLLLPPVLLLRLLELLEEPDLPRLLLPLLLRDIPEFDRDCAIERNSFEGKNKPMKMRRTSPHHVK